jgi:hypothetical protein
VSLKAAKIRKRYCTNCFEQNNVSDLDSKRKRRKKKRVLRKIIKTRNIRKKVDEGND